MGLFSRNKPKIKVQTTKRDGFSGWIKCTQCGEMIHGNELEKNENCCPKCDYHYRLSSIQRVEMLADPSSFNELFASISSYDFLEFIDSERYEARIKNAQDKTSLSDAIIVGTCSVGNMRCALGVMDFAFMGGSMGSVVGERITRLIELAIEEGIPLILVATSGGARMQESILSLMQMAKTSAALARLNDKGIPYISILTNPTTGGVTASFASLGDVIIAEPNALIGFAGPRVIEQVLGKPLPPGTQQAESLLKHGLIDCIVSRHDMKAKLIDILTFLSPHNITTAVSDESFEATATTY